MPRSLLIITCTVTMLMAIGAARAQNLGNADPDLLLGAIKTFPTEAAAQAGCGKDIVVWAERYAGYYFRRGEAGYGTKEYGAFTCMQSAQDANYWDTNPLSVMGPSHPGRNFPYPPLPLS
ncbi:MAG TPA: hypothetical protein VNT30_16900 [Stellaceae bacterium]|nr:hypothetical protein [Stellaceae bacterium]